MAGVVITAFCLRDWTFTGLQAGAGKDEEYCVLRNFPVDKYREASLVVRVHSSTITAGTSTIEVVAKEEAPSAEDPATDFVGSEVATASVGSGVTAPDLVQADFAADFGGYVSIFVRGTKTTGGDTITAKLSVDLVLKE